MEKAVFSLETFFIFWMNLQAEKNSSDNDGECFQRWQHLWHMTVLNFMVNVAICSIADLLFSSSHRADCGGLRRQKLIMGVV